MERDSTLLDTLIEKIDTRSKQPMHIVWLCGALGVLVLAIALYFFWLSFPPSSFPVNQPITIEPGLSAGEIADELHAQGVVRSADLLYLAIVIFHDPESIKAGSYVFQDSDGVFAIARLITDDNPPVNQLSLTFYEGTTAAAYAEIAAKYLPEFDEAYFIEHTRDFEGYLFPDTYYLPYTYTAEELIELLRSTYRDQLTPLFAANDTDLSEYEVLTLASLIEREANSEESMRIVAGILMNRLSIGMPLQVDASMEYVIDKPLDELTPEDLDTDSPYNTYLYAGLPPTPIGNPGVAAVKAVLDPITTDYLFYITGSDGNFYYATTYDEHLDNIATHL